MGVGFNDRAKSYFLSNLSSFCVPMNCGWVAFYSWGHAMLSLLLWTLVLWNLKQKYLFLYIDFFVTLFHHSNKKQLIQLLVKDW